MSFVQNLLGRGRIKSARKRLAAEPSPGSYAALANEYARLGRSAEALDVCEEGCGAFPGNRVLSRLASQLRRIECEDRMRSIRVELADAPRPALFKEMCELLIEIGTLTRAHEFAERWVSHLDDGEARLMLARIRVERFLADRGRALGLAAAEALDRADERLENDVRSLRLRLNLMMKVGAWKDARSAVRRLLQLQPGTLDLENRYRALEPLCEGAPSLEHALITVERTGCFADEKDERGGTTTSAHVRPILRELSKANDVHAALYVRGSTVLIQGPRGATAERIARGVRSILSSGVNTARRLGLGQAIQIQLEGDFGRVTLAPGTMDAGAIWSQGALGREREEVLMGLAGMDMCLGDGEDA